MTTAVDANVLFDILSKDPAHYDGSVQKLGESRSQGDLIVGEAAFAELAPWFGGHFSLVDFLDSLEISLVPSTPESLHLAGAAYRRYVRERGAYRCAQCGRAIDLVCPTCGSNVTRRQHIIADFLIGAHALIHAGRLLTRDRGYFGTYFPELELA